MDVESNYWLLLCILNVGLNLTSVNLFEYIVAQKKIARVNMLPRLLWNCRGPISAQGDTGYPQCPIWIFFWINMDQYGSKECERWWLNWISGVPNCWPNFAGWEESKNGPFGMPCRKAVAVPFPPQGRHLPQVGGFSHGHSSQQGKPDRRGRQDRSVRLWSSAGGASSRDVAYCRGSWKKQHLLYIKTVGVSPFYLLTPEIMKSRL